MFAGIMCQRKEGEGRRVDELLHEKTNEVFRRKQRKLNYEGGEKESTRAVMTGDD